MKDLWIAACGAALACACATASAQEAEDEALAELLDVIAEETDIATRSRQNADYVPGIVSVLSGDELRALGARNALDALALVPGIEISRDDVGSATLRVRGLEFFFNTGNVKVLINGVDTSFQISGRNSALLLLPIELVDRIEVIRGPGASVHGDFAFTGLVNVVTRTDRKAVAIEAGSGSARSANASWSGNAGGLAFATNVAATTSDRYDVPHTGEADERRAYGDFHAKWRGFSLRGIALDREQERFAAPAPGQAPRLLRNTEDVTALEARYEIERGPEQRVSFFGTWSNASYVSAQRFDAHRIRWGVDATWRHGVHLLLGQATFGGLSIEGAQLPGAAGPAPPPGRPRRPAFISDHLPAWSLLLQDSIDLTPKWTLTLGARFDVLDNLDSRLTPRAALVWRANERHTLKAQYAEGFRTPLLVELYDSGIANDRVDFELVRTRELGYIYRHPKRVLRATLFDADLPNLINPTGPPGTGFSNPGVAATRGAELEWNEHLTPWLTMVANVSFMDTEDSRGPPRLPPGQTAVGFGEADALANLGLVARPNERWTIGAHWNHVGDRASPTREFDGYDALALSVEHSFARVPRLRLRATLRNALGEDITHPISAPSAAQVRVLDYGERLGFVTLEYAF